MVEFRPYVAGLHDSRMLAPVAQSTVVAGQPERKSGLYEFYRSILPAEPPATPVRSAMTGLRANAEGGAIGALLALVDTDFGGLDFQGRYPIDGIAAVVLYALSIRDADKPDGLAVDFRNASAACTTVALYRNVKAWRENAKAAKASPTAVHGARNEDPLIAAARAAGI